MSYLRIILNLGVLGAGWGAFTAARQARREPRRWLAALLLGSAAISLALAVIAAVDKQKEVEAANDDD